MMRRVLFPFLILLLAALAMLVVLSRHSFVRETMKVPTFWPVATRSDSSLLLQKWLQARGFATQRKGGPLLKSELPPGGTLVLEYLSHPLSASETTLLLDWVQAGGCLIADATISPFDDERGSRALLDRLELSLTPYEEDRWSFSVWEDQFEDGEIPYRIQRHDHWLIQADEADWDRVMGTDQGAVLVSGHYGKGSIVVFSDMAFLSNMSFEKLDHAAWVARVLQENGADPAKGAVVWSKPVEMALFPWLWEKARPFLIAAGVLILAWLWSGLFRFGAVLQSEARPRRSLLEHLQASGRFLWRRDGREALLAVSREAVVRRAERIFPAFSHLPEMDRRAFLAQRSGLSEDEVADALDTHPGITIEEQARRLQILQTLRQRIAAR